MLDMAVSLARYRDADDDITASFESMETYVVVSVIGRNYTRIDIRCFVISDLVGIMCDMSNMGPSRNCG